MSPKTALHNTDKNKYYPIALQKGGLAKRWPLLLQPPWRSLKASARQKDPGDNQELSKIAK